ncbi:hypothetical protein Nepgr_025994 [Nepenthes gracilis]|uniref:Uncharacterized protein n=1 Tax=Nepenthes gracilis TaxID=150966 RepID=A0AAD3Y221_NEPGR|nr:hypothetical protein Nepgr_025994 [Nepenthes gracilis]
MHGFFKISLVLILAKPSLEGWNADLDAVAWYRWKSAASRAVHFLAIGSDGYEAVMGALLTGAAQCQLRNALLRRRYHLRFVACSAVVAVDGSGRFPLMLECSRVFGVVNFADDYLVVSKLDPELKPPAACCSTAMRPVISNDIVVLVGWRNSSIDVDRYY